MPQNTEVNRQIVLAERPVGAPTSKNFRLEEAAIPTPGEGEMLLRTVYLSLDPYMRGRMSDAKSYADPVEIGDAMVGGTVSVVVKSNLKNFSEGDWVVSLGGWQDYSISNGEMVFNLGKEPAMPSWALGIMGMPGFTAYAGLLEIGEPKPGETIAVAAASGPVGATVGQIGKIKGCRVVGIAGGAEKCKHAVDNLGFDVCLDRNSPTFAQDLKAACPDGIDVYFENVGGAVFDAVLPLLNANARIPLCGLISQYNATSLPDGPDRMGLLMGTLLVKKIRMQGFIIFDSFPNLYPKFAADMQQWIAEGKVKYREQMVDGLENAPEAFMGLLEGKNFGKLVVKIGD
ncbi:MULTISPECIES: NADP-dependent oxidoreductase [unclassified Pseudovibrio]|uniref:NADP-dependent oxidoreductase n=1 Tax=unclassified Pseudovibrio TaxID=2627060 RepID=UPI0007AE4C57|nr:MULTISPECIES: NADP-dependent oxidoreductase [unclassified Pseudovibrio]KZK92890.1 NADPH-dependent curcumin reductase [Pseudovibrio sp. Ad5]KZL13164.1 NADPH-dependent curcumin reductase [Pseudovibrio sp. Ad26]KZL26728.1 NADPH-dependent curcumin reductase [Pseudovibrio sp. Ad37]